MASKIVSTTQFTCDKRQKTRFPYEKEPGPDPQFLAGIGKSKLHVHLLWRRTRSNPSPLTTLSPAQNSVIVLGSINKAAKFSRKNIPGNKSYKPTANLLPTSSHRFGWVCRSMIARFFWSTKWNHFASWTKATVLLLAH